MHVQNALQTHCSWTRLAAISTFSIFLCLLLMYNEDYYLTRQSSTILISKYSNSKSVPFSTTTESMLNVTLQSFNSVSDTQGFLVKSPKCQIPDFDPFDESIKKFLKPAKPIICSTETPLTYVTTVTDNISMLTYKLVINSTILNSMSKDNLQCCVSVVTRFTIPPDRKVDRSVDNLYNVSRCKNFEEEITLANSTEFILVKCYDKSSPNKDVYTNMHSVIPVKENVQKKIENNTDDEEKLNVLLLGIDSMSRLNMLRSMPKTVSLLRKRGWTELRSHLRVEDNTLPNILGVFTGYTLKEITDKRICAPKTLKSDDCPLIWKNFSDHGYVTMYAEDQSVIGTFNYEKVGFVKQPTDYYLRPYIVAAEKLLPTKKQLRAHCLGYQSMTDHVYDYLSKFLDVFKTYPFFAHVWLNNFSHNDHNVPAVMDERYVQFFTDLHDNIIINKTLIIFFGDHGIRFGEIRETYVGWLETNMPFIYIWVPEWFRKRYPEAYHNLQANSKRLTSHFDLYMTLKSVLNRSYMNTSDVTDVSTTCKSCVSLFDSLIGDRSCEDIGVNSEFCACSQYKDVSVDDAHVHAAVLHTISNINLKLKSGTSDIENKTKCANINLLQKMSAKKKINPSKKALSYEEFLIVFKTTPGEAIFETTVRYLKSNKTETIGMIERINSYGNQSHCVHDSELKLYCFCTV